MHTRTHTHTLLPLPINRMNGALHWLLLVAHVLSSDLQVRTSHELVQSSVHTSKHEWFTFIVHHLNSELVHSSVHFIVLMCVFSLCVKITPKIIRCIRCSRWVYVYAFTCHFHETCMRAVVLEYVACLVYMCVRWIMGNVVQSRVSWFRLGYIANILDDAEAWTVRCAAEFPQSPLSGDIGHLEGYNPAYTMVTCPIFI